MEVPWLNDNPKFQTHNMINSDSSLLGVLSWETSPDVLSPTSHMEDALRVVDTGIRSYLSSNNGLGTVPNSCSLEVQKENIKIWDRPSLKWWQPGIDLYE